MKKKTKKKLSRDDKELTLLALPTAIWYILFSYLPMIGLLIAFKDFRIFPKMGFIGSLLKSEWVGFTNFEFLFRTPAVFTIIRNTLGYNIVFIMLGVIVPVSLAIAITQLHGKKLAKVYQTSMFLPHFLSWVVVSYFLYAFLSQDKGVFNQIIQFFGGTPINWYSEPKYWTAIIIFMNVWKTVGYGMVVYLSSITSIDASLYEAAIVDGATIWQQIKNITLPSLKSIMIIMFILAIGNVFRSDFGLFYQVPRNSGPLFDVTATIDTYVYQSIKGTGDLNLGSATAFLQSVIGFIFIVGANTIVTKLDSDSALF